MSDDDDELGMQPFDFLGRAMDVFYFINNIFSEKITFLLQCENKFSWYYSQLLPYICQIQ